jgi:uncharacterized phiE125 gp8 family phage protein
MKNILISTPPESEPVTVSELKKHCNIYHDEDDAYLKGVIMAARNYVENYVRRALITQTIQARFDCFPGHIIELERAPVQSVTSITYTNTAGVPTVLDASAYTVDIYSSPARIVPASGTTWPSTDDDVPSAVVIEYIAGYGTSRENVPDALRHGVLMQAAHFYENREPTVMGGMVSKIPETVDALIGPYRVW